jgi:hypothetical protein
MAPGTRSGRSMAMEDYRWAIASRRNARCWMREVEACLAREGKELFTYAARRMG